MPSYLTLTGTEPAAPPEIWGFDGDSTTEGLSEEMSSALYAREAGDTDWPDVYQYRLNGTITSDTTPLDSIGSNNAFDRFAWPEYFGKTRAAEIGAKVYLVQCAVNGSSAGIDENGWCEGGGLNETTISRTNAAIAAIQAIEPTAVFKGFAGSIGSNESDVEAYHDAYLGALTDRYDRIFMNGISGETAAGNITHLFVAMRPEHTQIELYWPIDGAMRDMSYELPGGKFYTPAWGYGDLHPYNTGVRLTGIGAAEVIASTTAPTFSLLDYSIPANGPYIQELISSDEDGYWYLTGPNAAAFEIERTPYNIPFIGGDPNGHRSRHYIQWAGGVTQASGTFEVTVNLKGGNGVVTSHDITVTVGSAPYTDLEEQFGSALIGYGLASDLSNGAVAAWANKVPTTYMSNLAKGVSATGLVRAATSYGGAPGVTLNGSDDVLHATLTGMPTNPAITVITAFQHESGSESNARLVSLADAGNDDNYIPLYKSASDKIAGGGGTALAPVTIANSTPQTVTARLAKVLTDDDHWIAFHTTRVNSTGSTASPFNYEDGWTPTRISIGGNPQNGGDNISGVLAGYGVVLGTVTDAQLVMAESFMTTLT